MKSLMILMIFLGSFSACKEPAPKIQEITNQKEDPFVVGISSLYDEIYTDMGKEYTIDRIEILKVYEVSGRYVDSLRRNFFQKSIENIENSNKMREINIKKMKRKAFRHDSLGNELEATYAQEALEQSERAIDIANIELKQLNDLDAQVLKRMEDNKYGNEINYFVEFNIEMTVNMQKLSNSNLSQVFDSQKNPIKIHLLE